MIDYEDIFYGISEEMIEKNIENLDSGHWLLISSFLPLTESFVEKYKDKIDWGEASRSQDFSEFFLLNNLEFIDIEGLSYNPSISKELLEKVKFLKDLQS
jgi:hypothetical protein